ncbi:transcription elongation factor GreAB [Lacisediminihabitans profunda]|uniref:Transcription elongation factor GreAB n=2 Tax=Lacisediminihabitans profunda TaxID=2594790 RepID=A0A5C8UKM3_9MICO|nr:transcription elongation factor GreAB [Lacisediminihabitans profunda]
MTWIPPAVLATLTEELAHLTDLPSPSNTELERTREVRRLLRSAEATIKPDDGLVEPGMRITARLAGETRATVFLLGDRNLSALDPNVTVDVYSPTSPLGSAIIGSYVGDVISYTTPSGSQMTVEILAAAPYTG